MERTTWDFIRELMPLSKKHRQDIALLSRYLNDEQIKIVKQLIKTKRAGIVTQGTNISKNLAHIPTLKQLHASVKDVQVHAMVNSLNKLLKEKTYESSYRAFAPHALEKIKDYIAPNILGLEEAKTAALLQLFSKERFHLLLLGDPGTGKTDILRSVHEIAPISSFGLGSGTSGVGLSVSMKGNEIQRGLLPRANNGICCIDELNLMKKEDRAALYSAMEKGFVTYDKKGTHEKVDAQVRVLATANPVGDKFVGQSLAVFKDQLPFDSALLTRFHMTFVVREPSKERLVSIAKKIVRNKQVKLREEDVNYIKDYITYANTKPVAFDTQYEKNVTDFIEETKSNEALTFVDVGPRIVHGVMRVAQAHARLHLREKVNSDDVNEAIDLLGFSLQIPGVTRN